HTEENITVTVNKRPTALSYSGDASAQYSDPAAVKAALTDDGGGARQGQGISGKPITLTIGSQSPPATPRPTALASPSIPPVPPRKSSGPSPRTPATSAAAPRARSRSRKRMLASPTRDRSSSRPHPRPSAR